VNFKQKHMITDEQKNKLGAVVQRLIAPMNVACEVAVKEEKAGDKDTVVVSISAAEDARFLIGKNGQNLQALEHIVRSIFSKGTPGHDGPIFIDVNDYRKSKASHIADLAREAVQRVRNTQRAEALVPMSSYERRIVHMELASVADVTTESIGQEPQRRIVVKPYRSLN